METATTPFALLVDDDAIIRMDASDILGDAGFRVIEACSGDDAIPILERMAAGIVLLFTDVQMPGSTDGFALARHTAAHFPEIEIIVASGHTKPRDGDMPDKAIFIGKPFSAQVVHDHLRDKLPDGKRPDALKNAM
jgi:CheY-like chemotaxis protein